VRKAGKDRLIVHTSKLYPNRLFVLFYQENFSEIRLKSVPFVSDDLKDLLLSRDP